MTWLIDFIKLLFDIKNETKQTSAPAQASAAPRADSGPGTSGGGGALQPADYSSSFFSGKLGSTPIPPYKLPAGARGYGIGGAYDRESFDPRFYDPVTRRILGTDGTYIDVAQLTRHYPGGSTDKIAPETMRQWLYGLSLDPASVPGDLLSLALVNAPRQISRSPLGAGQGAFGA